MESKTSPDLSRIPSVEKVKKTPRVSELLRELSDEFVTAVVREVIEETRALCARAGGDGESLSLDNIEDEVVNRTTIRLLPPLRRVINGTGIVIHTNLGRSVIGHRVIEALSDAAGHYCNLEIDLHTGERGHRDSLIEPLLCQLTGAEAATVVNNNAAAVVLSLDTLARGREVIVSRGELIEIGGSFRMPDVMEKSGARLVEVGTTNRTYGSDYERALSPETSLLLKVHPSNFQIVGFTHQVELRELVALGHKRGIPVMEDLGSGALVDVSHYGIKNEPMAQESIAAGADVVTFSCDKLLGGPQAGVILGKREYIRSIKKNPLMRAFRVDKITLSALGTICKILLSSRHPEHEIPTLGMMARSADEIRELAARVCDGLETEAKQALNANIIDGDSRVGGGSCPEQSLPTKLLVLRPQNMSADSIAKGLRQGTPPIIGIIRNDCFCLDFRTVQPDEVPEIVAALCSIVREQPE